MLSYIHLIGANFFRLPFGWVVYSVVVFLTVNGKRLLPAAGDHSNENKGESCGR